MAKKLSDIKQSITDREACFVEYLKDSLDQDVLEFLLALCELGHCYLFSGIIRDFFLNMNGIRDVDIMIDTSIDIGNLINPYAHRKNSFGGYKVCINGTTIDLWYLKDTWALNNYQKVIDLEIDKYIPSTAFFNFSSIMFSFAENKFIYTKSFLRFLRDKKIDYVYKPNANYALCVINSLYYQDKLKLPFSDRLEKYIMELYWNYQSDYDATQIKHFGKILYSKADIQSRINAIITK